jgi:hypothetical protein
MSLPDLTFHGCFGRFAGDASEPIDFLSDEWTQVRNKKRQGKKKQRKEISNPLGNWKTFQNVQGIAKLEVAPKEHIAYHSQNNSRSSRSKASDKKSTSDDLRVKKFQNYVMNLSTEEISNKMRDLITNDVELLQERSVINHNLKCIKKSFERSIELIAVQKKLYDILVTFEILRLPTCWRKVMVESEGASMNIPLRSQQDRLSRKLQAEEKLKSRLLSKLKAGENFMDTLNLKITKALTAIYEMQEEAADWNRLYDNFNVLNYCYVDSTGALHDDTMHDPDENVKCHRNLLPRRKIPKKELVERYFKHKKNIYQHATVRIHQKRSNNNNNAKFTKRTYNDDIPVPSTNPT